MSQRILKDWLTSFLQFLENSEPVDRFKIWTAISVIAAVLKRKCFLSWGHLTFYPNMYIVLVGPSGCRKGTAMTPGYDLLNDLGINLSAEATTREALIRKLNKARDTTIDPVTGEIYIHASLTIYSQELAVFLGYNNPQLLSDLTDWYDCRTRWTYETKNQGTDEIRSVWVNLFGAITPELLQTSLPRDAIGGGLTSRMIFVCATGKGRLIPDPFLSEEAIELRKCLVHDLELIHMLCGRFTVTPEFMEAWVPWYMSQEETKPFDDYRFGGYIERRPNHLLKLCMILNASRTSDMTITAADFERAKAVLEDAESMMLTAFRGVGDSKLASTTERIMSYIASRKSVTLAELTQRFYQDVDARTMKDILDSIRRMKFAEIGEHRGRDTVITYIHQKS